MKAKQIFLVVLFLMKLNSSFSQTNFAKRIDNGNAYGFAVGQDTTYSVVTMDGYFIRYNKFGLKLSQIFKNSTSLDLNCMRVISSLDSGYFISGSVIDSNQRLLPFVAKTNSNGEMQWLRYPSSLFTNSYYITIQLSDGNLLSSTNYYDSLTSYQAIYIQKLDSSGNLIWAKTINCPQDFMMGNLSATNENGFMITGQRSPYTTIARFDSLGNVVWSEKLSIPNSGGISISELSDGNFIVLGSRNLTSVIKFFLAKIDTSGNLLWFRAYDRPGSNNAFKFIERSNGDLIVVGGEINYKYGFLLDTDSNGVPKFAMKYSSEPLSLLTFIRNVFESNDKSLTLFGQGEFGGWSASLLFKVDSLGEGICNSTPDTFQYTSPGYSAIPDTFVVSPFTGIISSLVCTSTFVTESDLNYCTNNEVAILEEDRISIYPNPVTENISFHLNDNFNAQSIEVYNSLGQKVCSISLQGENRTQNLSIPISLPNGIYFGKLYSSDKVSYFNFVVAN